MVFSKLFEQAVVAAKRNAGNTPATSSVSVATQRADPTSSSSSVERKDPKRKRRHHHHHSDKEQMNRTSTLSIDKTKKKFKKDHGSRPSNFRKKKQQPPSSQALELSKQLQALSRQKKLTEALDLYWNNKNDNCIQRDEHHACIVIDCCAKCGDVSNAERIFHTSSLQPNKHPNVTTQTALLKVYVHAGEIDKAMTLFQNIHTPNIRTLNTLLRGCLWTPVGLHRDTNNHSIRISGGVVSSEEAWTRYLISFPKAHETLDVSAYEQAISLLCQALRLTEAEARFDSFRQIHAIRIKGTAGISGGDQASLETCAVCFLALARAYALTMNHSEKVWNSSQCALSSVKASRALLFDNRDSNVPVEKPSNRKKRNQTIKGGRQGWKKEDNEQQQDVRSFSNVAFRTHRLAEIEMDVKALLKRRKNCAEASSPLVFAKHMSRRFLCFSGGGSTVVSQTNDPVKLGEANHSILLSLYYGFGLSHFIDPSVPAVPAKNPLACLKKVKEACELGDNGVVRSDGTIDFDVVFDDNTKPLDIEVGAGFGSWIAHQATENASRNFVAVELRADRAYQIFCKSMIEGEKQIDNLCVVGSECGTFLRNLVKKSSVSNFYANFPEPPSQTFGDSQRDLDLLIHGESEPIHMLTSQTIIEMGNCLKPHGKINVITDNQNYARLLAATFAKVIKGRKKFVQPCKPGALTKSSLRKGESYANVDIYKMDGTSAVGSSYFDRLWQTGAGSHSHKGTRFILLLQRC
jgi:pentatricopeptide repeat protein